MALLRHECLHGQSHFDWMLGRVSSCADPNARVVRAFRCNQRVDTTPPPFEIQLEPLPDHRWFYLTLVTAHDLSHERGTVWPVAAGLWRSGPPSDAGLDESIEIQFNHSHARHLLRITSSCSLVWASTASVP